MTANATSNLKSLYPDQFVNAEEVVPEALLFKITSVLGEVEGDAPRVKIPYIKTDPEVGFVPEGGEISTDEPELDEVEINTGKLAVISTVTNEAAAHKTATDMISQSMRRAIVRKADMALFGNSGASPTGLANLPDIQSGFNLDGQSFDAIAEAIVALQSEDANPSHIVTSPAVWGNLLNLKAAKDSNTPLVGSPSQAVGSSLFGIPLIVSTAVPQGKLFVLDQAQILSVASDIRANSSEGAYFSHDITAYRATWRIGWAMVHPERLAMVTDPSVTTP